MVMCFEVSGRKKRQKEGIANLFLRERTEAKAWVPCGTKCSSVVSAQQLCEYQLDQRIHHNPHPLNIQFNQLFLSMKKVSVPYSNIIPSG
jgi:hypothetical protein